MYRGLDTRAACGGKSKGATNEGNASGGLLAIPASQRELLLLRQFVKMRDEDFDHPILEAGPRQISQRLACHREDLCLGPHRKLVTKLRSLLSQGLGQLRVQLLRLPAG